MTGQSPSLPDFARRVVTERAKLAAADPKGEAEAVVPVLPMTPEAWDAEIAATPLEPSDRPWPQRASHKDSAMALTDPWLIEGVLRPGRYMVLAAAEGVGKSYARLELAIRLATGHGHLFDHYPIPGPCRVLLIDVENGSEEETRREEEILERFGLGRSDLRDYWTLSIEGLSLTDAADQDYIRGAIGVAEPAVVIFDTGSSMVGDEWGGELKAAVRFLRKLTREYGCAVVVAVHLVKPARERKRGKEATHGQELADVMGQWTRQADSVALMSPSGDGVLWRMAKRVPSSTLLLAPAAGTFHALQVVAGDDGGASTRERIYGAIVGGMTDAADIAAYAKVTERTVWRHVAGLRRDGRLTPDGPLSVSVSAPVSPPPRAKRAPMSVGVSDSPDQATDSVSPPIGGMTDSVSPPCLHDANLYRLHQTSHETREGWSRSPGPASSP